MLAAIQPIVTKDFMRRAGPEDEAIEKAPTRNTLRWIAPLLHVPPIWVAVMAPLRAAEGDSCAVTLRAVMTSQPGR